MINNLLKYGVILCLSVFVTSTIADQNTIKNSIERAYPGLKVDTVQPSEVKGLYEVFIGPQLYYVSADGRYLLQGTLRDLKTKKDLTEPKVARARANAIDKVGPEKMVIFKSEKPKHVVSVFTDIDCGYCRKLHSEIDQYLERGISIQYLFFPRAGKDSDSYNKAVSVWCSDDRNKALTAAKQGQTMETKTCDNPVLEHMALSSAFGARGTPMIVFDDGNTWPGYLPADKLAKLLDSRN